MRYNLLLARQTYLWHTKLVVQLHTAGVWRQTCSRLEATTFEVSNGVCNNVTDLNVKEIEHSPNASAKLYMQMGI